MEQFETKAMGAADFQAALGVKDTTSPAMASAIREWYSLYFGQGEKGAGDSQRIACAIVNKLQRVVFAEYRASFCIPVEAYYREALDSLNDLRRNAMQQLLVGGEVLLKPVAAGKLLHWAVVPRCNFIPLGRDEQGRLTDLGLVERRSWDGCTYRLLERRTLTPDGLLVVENRLFCAKETGSYGVEVPLDTLPCYAGLERRIVCPKPLNGLGLVQMKAPGLNCVDLSHDGVSVYAAAVELIKAADRNEMQMNSEFENGASRILVSADLLTVRRDSNGRPVKRLQDTVFTALDESPEEVPITVFNPSLRTESFLARKRDTLRSIESVIGLARGTLSQVEETQRTATEIADSRAEYALAAADYQEVWEKALKEAMRLAVDLGMLYGLCSQELEVSGVLAVDWGNGLLYDEEKDWAQLTQMAASGILKPELLLAWKYGLPHSTSVEVEHIREQYMPQKEDENEHQ